MSTNYILGADPGKAGAIALISTSADINHIKPEDVILLPTKVSSETGRIDTATMQQLLAPYTGMIQAVWLEQVHAIFGASAKSTFEFGVAYGMLYSLLQSLTEHVYEVTPKTWQHTVWNKLPADKIVSTPVIDKTTKLPKILKSGKPQIKIDTKQTSSRTAELLFPKLSFVMPRCKKEHDGCVDAALLAYYGLHRYKLTRR